ncbi:cytochrome P450 family protein [Nonomuraea gerenzanensis]|uniref:Putative cytochrome P450 hydroxylase n=1 Tax=Nonomuraea gerenzanensis TaxID=93944 RepID=A0A1M4DXA8_9ACTN|nr:cytochrome P450 [Nonomuraea gerenzanensis]UBU13549.1 cytochrome P450 [Nonomuraea gerenzanensis]SBO91213.1 putative cytochrome P450 hydroxylase [Nonomuraea gerenzanensis]
MRPAIAHRRLRVWLVTRYAEARELLNDPSLAKDSARAVELFPPGTAGPYASSLAAHMLNSDPPDHTRLRRLVNKEFTARTVSRLRPRIEQITDGLLDGLAGAGESDLLESFAFPLPIAVICELLGIPASDHDEFRTWTAPFVAASSAEEMGAAHAWMLDYLTRLVAAKRAEPGEDLLSQLVHGCDEGDRLSHDEVVSMAFLLLVAGHETTVNLIANSVLALIADPDQQAALRADPALLPGAVEEFLRFDGPINIATLRFTTEPVRVGDVEIPANEFVFISLLAANRDPDRFPDPDRLDLTRQDGGHLAFGHGIHYCVGAPLARLEAQIAIGRLLDRFTTIEPASPTLRWRASTLIRGLETLPVRLR